MVGLLQDAAGADGGQRARTLLPLKSALSAVLCAQRDSHPRIPFALDELQPSA
jgi:hypothetical protein